MSDLAEVTLAEALASLDPPVPMAIVAMGRFGGAELSYASDLDVLIVFDGRTNAEVTAAEETAEALVRTVRGTTPAARLFTLDLDLRPEGRDGPLARSIEGYQTYYARWARTWERQSLIRARPVAGDADVARRFMEVVDDFVWRRSLDDDGQREIRRMKARIERERLPAGEDPQFHLKLGKGSLSDVEWTAQLLQLRHQIRSPGTMAALGALEEAGVLDPADADVLAVAYRFCERTRNRLYLVRGAPGDALPTQADQLSRLARSLGTSAVALREEYRRVTRRARLVVERLFYGIDQQQRR
jgi:glutamate-ammonia-ligase adenylyltransferase